MTVDIRAAALRVSRLLGERELRHFAAGLGLAYAAAILTLLVSLLVFPGTQHRAVASAPAISGATGADTPCVDAHHPGSGYVESEPLPAEPREVMPIRLRPQENGHV
jgi:hypothetical protein